MDKTLRFGDVLKGIVLANTLAKSLPVGDSFNIDVSIPAFSVVISPCCSIGNQMICLCPLFSVQRSYFDNPYFAEDLTRINRSMEPKQTVAPHIWDKFPPDEQDRRIARGNEYALIDIFVYGKHDLLPSYPVRTSGIQISTNYYQIDFRQITRVNCSQIVRDNKGPLEAKILQLSIETRQELRDKISSFYGRVPTEDQILLG